MQHNRSAEHDENDPHCKKCPYIRGYFAASSPYAVGARVSLFRRFTDTNVYGTGSVKMWKTRHEISVDVRIFFHSACSCWARRLSVIVIVSDNQLIPLVFAGEIDGESFRPATTGCLCCWSIFTAYATMSVSVCLSVTEVHRARQ